MCVLDYTTGKKKSFQISRFQNDYLKLIEFLNSCKSHGYTGVGFNNKNFDAQVIQFIQTFNGNPTCEDIYNEAQRIIELPDNERYLHLIPEWKLIIPQLDLYLIHHFNNRARICSLKWLEFTMRLDKIEDMPIHHGANLTEEDIKLVEDYCWNDIYATKQFLDKSLDKIELREDIREEFGINCMNYNDVKIGDEINKITYSRLSDIEKYDLPKKGTFRNSIRVLDCIKFPIKFESKKLQDFYDNFTKIEFNPREVKEHKGANFKFKYLGISFGFGGIHSNDWCRKFESNEEYYLSDKDCTGMYPRTIIEQRLYPEHLGENWYKGCEYVYNKRANEYKPQSKTNKKAKSYSEAYKLANNGGSFGKTNEVTSWQYDPLVTFSITIFNQFALLKLAEMLILNDIEVISLNTDGCLSRVKYIQKEKYEEICKEWEVISHHTLEETLYSKFVQTSVNDYIAQTTDGKIKQKGDFEVNKELHKNNSMTIIPMALEAYFIKGVPFREFIQNPENNIMDYCKGVKVKSNFKMTLHKVIRGDYSPFDPHSKVIRYFLSKSGGNLIKHFNDGRNIEVESGWKSELLMDLTGKSKLAKDYDIDYTYYIDKVRDMIYAIEGNTKQLSLNFI